MSSHTHVAQPLLLPPNRVWRSYVGGQILDTLDGAADPADGHFPEDWIGSTTRAINAGREHLEREGLSTALTADGTPIDMDRLIADAPEAVLGKAHVAVYGAQPQLLVKLLDSAVRLHVQAHPSVPWARAHLDSPSGKTEAWWILSARDPGDAWVLFGFQRPPSPEQWRRMLAEQDTEAMLACFDRIAVKPGDVLLVEGGVPHAIGPGLLMVEIQEPTDWVVRCEWAHGGTRASATSQTMGLGVDGVVDMFDYSAVPATSVAERFGPRPKVIAESRAGRETSLLARPQTDRVELRRVESTGDGAMGLDLDGRFSILIVLEGDGRLVADGTALPLGRWSRVFLPAALGSVTLQGTMTVARCMPPAPDEEM